MKVLIADDSLTMRLIMEQRLKAAGYDEVLHAESGVAVLNVLNATPDVDVVLLDWNMPVMNGIDCLRAIKRNKATQDVPVVMVTSENEKNKIIEAIQSGACNYLIKPFETKKLHDVLTGIADKRRQNAGDAGTEKVDAAHDDVTGVSSDKCDGNGNRGAEA